MRSVALATAVAVWLCGGICGQAGVASDLDLRALADENLRGLEDFPNLDAQGYGDLAWGVSYGMMALNVLYEASGDIAYLQRQAGLIEKLLDKRDSELAARNGDEAYIDYQRQRVLQAWGTGAYSGGKHTVWLVHTGMLAYPMAEFCRLVKAGGTKTAALKPKADSFLPKIEAIVAEFDGEWRDGPSPGMGYYVDPSGGLLPNNHSSAMARALFALSDAAGKARYRDQAAKWAAFLKSKLTRDAAGDYYNWAYSQGRPDGPPGTGEDISHAAINAHLMYVAWEHKAAFDATDMGRLARTFTKGLWRGEGQVAGLIGGRGSNDDFGAQCGRWAYLARFDPQIGTMIRQYGAAHPERGAIRGTTGALGYAYLLRAEKLSADEAQKPTPPAPAPCPPSG